MSDLNEMIVDSENGSIQAESKLWDNIMKYINTLAHLSIVGVTIYLIFLCFVKEFEYFTWHPFLYTIGWFLFMTEGVLMISKDNFFNSKLTHLLKVRFHWLLQTAASGCSIAGFVIIVVKKTRHFRSWHGLMGLLSMVFLVPTCLNGILALFNVKLRMYISPTVNKFFHAISGILTVVLGSITMVLSLYTNWFSKMTNKNQEIFVACFVFMTFGLLWSLFRPLVTSFRRLRTF
ncbi:PREDICTED: cytochrome b561 domain-containing protein 2-like [Nicrophorus vespilloides]|uniref:ascorbate ferrireductase (transmembrane) n=1 Tax=Nicrophorus vespilloides TaxID=110193 RepID=A0ABM1MV49_NICVS|nr:PREDICTED: cytochrome b561 domain-containing protein 2-like [Nicrophorus vespilloides]